jgi:hypothetical protein
MCLAYGAADALEWCCKVVEGFNVYMVPKARGRKSAASEKGMVPCQDLRILIAHRSTDFFVVPGQELAGSAARIDLQQKATKYVESHCIVQDTEELQYFMACICHR